MSKKKAVKRAVQKERQKEESGRVVVTTSRDKRGECMPVGHTLVQLDENIRNSIEWPEPPTYTMSFAGGETKEIPHDAESIKDGKTTDEEREAWAIYLVALDVAEAEFKVRSAEARMRLFATEGFIPLDPPDEDEWVERHEWIGYEVPDDPLERQLHFFLTEVIGNVGEDMLAIYKGIARATGTDEEVLSEMEASFRAAMERPQGKDAGAGAGDSGGEQEAGMVEQQQPPEIGGAGEPGADA